MTAEQKQKIKDYLKQYRENMTDEQKQKMKDYQKEYQKKKSKINKNIKKPKINAAEINIIT